MIQKIFLYNRRLCNRLQIFIPQAKFNIFDMYEQLVTKYMNSKPNQIIVDVGSGKQCPYAKNKERGINAKIVGVDISIEELNFNNDVDEKIISNAICSLPFKKDEVDIIASRSFLEHLEDIDKFISQSEHVLKSGGFFIHLLPCKFAPFSLINQIIPNKLAKKLLYFIIPESEGIGGFPAYYNKCYYTSMKKILENHDFEITESYFSYYQSPYFNFFLPLFLLSVSYEYLLLKANAKNLCAYMLIVARKN